MDAINKHDLSLKNYLAVCVTVGLLVVVACGFIAKDLVGRAIHNGKVLSAKQKASRQLDADLVAAPQLIASYSGLGDTRTLLDSSLPTGPDFSGYIAMMESAAADAGVSLKSVMPVAVQTEDAARGDAKPMPVNSTISVTGNYASLQRFFANIEKSSRPVRITDIQLSGASSSQNAVISATTYYQPKASLDLKTEYVK